MTAFESISGVLGDLNSDDVLDLDDFTMYLSGLHANLSGLTLTQAFMNGDLNGDLANDFDDFVLFRAYYDAAHGAGAFAALAGQVPEPSGWTLALVAAPVLRLWFNWGLS